MEKKNKTKKPRKKELEELTKKNEEQRKNAERVRLQEGYLTNKFNAEYTIAKINVIAEQLEKDKITQTFDGVPKTKEMLVVEYKSLKKAALSMAREVFFTKKRLIEEYDYTEEKLNEIERDIVENPVFRDEYSEKDRRIGYKRIYGS